MIRCSSVPQVLGLAAVILIASDPSMLEPAQEVRQVRFSRSFGPPFAPERPSIDQLDDPLEELESLMVRVEGGTFTMGCTPEQGKCGKDAYPAHQVTVSSFLLCKYEVTKKLWRAVMGVDSRTNNYGYKDEGDRIWISQMNQPVYFVNWDEVQVFLTKLHALTGETYRLPTEAEWEYAARGGNKSRGFIYAGSNDPTEVAIPRRLADAVGSKAPNELGLYDMTGSVQEWCQDWYGEKYYATSPSDDPQGPESGKWRINRGGSYTSYAKNCRVSARSSWPPNGSHEVLGFRLAKSE